MRLQSQIQSYLKERSNIASNRLIKNKDPNDENYQQLIPARYLEENHMQLFEEFPFNDQISKSCFFKYLNISGQFKHPHRYYIKILVSRYLFCIKYLFQVD